MDINKKKNIIVFLESNLEKTIKRNYTFTLRMKSNFDSDKINFKYNIKYIKFTKFTVKDIIEGDIFIFYKSHFFLKSTYRLIQIIKKFEKVVLYDIDDYYLDIPDYSFSRHLNKGRRLRIFQDNLSLSDYIVVSTEPLKNQFIQFNKNICIIENTINPHEIGKRLDHNNVIKILVTSSDNLKIKSFKNDFLRCLYDIKKKYNENIKIVFLGKFSNVESINSLADDFCDRIPPDEYQEYLIKNNFEIGLVPLGGEEDPETLLSHSCKSNIKFLEFADFGIAGVYSNVKPYNDVKDRKEGIIVNNTYSEWFEAISALIDDEKLRKQIVSNSRKKLENSYSKKVSQDKFLKLLNSMYLSNIEKRKDVGNYSSINYKILYISFLYLSNIASQKLIFVFMLVKNGEFREIWNRIVARLRG